MKTLMKFIKDILTENDGYSYCPIRVFAFFLSVPTIGIYTAAGIMQLLHGHLDLQSFATAFATLSAGYVGFGASVALKATTDTK